MTPENLEELVALGDSAKLVDAVADLTETERRSLSKTAQQLKRAIDSAGWEIVNNSYARKQVDRLLQYIGTKNIDVGQQSCVADLAVLAVGPLSQAKKVQARMGYGNEENPALKIMLDRRPEWIDDWVEASVEEEFPSLDWETLWGLVQAGACRKPASEGYYRAMAQLLNVWRRPEHDNHIPLSELLESDPELLEDVWKLFEVDTVAFCYDWDE